MKTKTISLALFATLLLASAPLFADSTIPLDLEWGYRWIDVDGNEDMYRSQSNEQEGLLVRDLSLDLATAAGGSHLFDRLRIDAAGIGAGPDGSFRLQAGLGGWYSFRLGYTRHEQWSALPAFANPFFDQGTIPGQHTLDRTRQSIDARIELLPGKMISPILEYRRTRDTGPGSSTLFVGQDEFLLSTELTDTEEEIRGGLGFHLGPIGGEVLYGKRTTERDEDASLAAGAGAGNNSGTVLGVPVNLDSYERHSSVDGDTPVASAHIVGRIGPNSRFVASWIRTKPEFETSEQESLAGDLVSFQLRRFFGGREESVASLAKSEQTNANARFEISLFDKLDFDAGWSSRERDLEGSALVESLYLATSTYDHTDPRDLEELLSANTRLERKESGFDARLAAHDLGPFGLHVSGGVRKEETTVSADPSEILIPTGQEGDFERRIDTLGAGVRVAFADILLTADWDREKADEVVIRTDIRNRDRYRVRAGWKPGPWINLLVTGEKTKYDNLDSGLDSEGELKQGSVRIESTPIEGLTLSIEAGRYQNEHSQTILNPWPWASALSLHEEDGQHRSAAIDWKIGRFLLAGSWDDYENDGSFGFELERSRVRLGVDVTANLSILAEGAEDRYTETPSLLGSYKAKRWGLYLRWRQ
jgi:hypothetical protein